MKLLKVALIGGLLGLLYSVLVTSLFPKGVEIYFLLIGIPIIGVTWGWNADKFIKDNNKLDI